MFDKLFPRTPPPSLCPPEFTYLVPKRAKLIIELLEIGMGPNKGDDKYFLLGTTARSGFAISAVLSPCWPDEASFCKFPLSDMEMLKEKMKDLSFVIEDNGFGCDGTWGRIRMQFPDLHFLDLRWIVFPHKSWKCIFDLIKEVEDMIANSPTRKVCAPRESSEG